MKKVFFVCLIVFVSMHNLYAQKDNDPVLLTVDGEGVTKSEFLRVYNKNNVDNEVIDKKSIDEYLELYLKFKLKVKEAENQKLDTAKAFKNELEGYRKQLAKPYMLDKEVTENLIKEAYERFKYDVRASHILLKLDKGASPKDTLEVYNRLLKIRKSILDEEVTFEDAAYNESEDPSAKDRPATKRSPARIGNKGDLGYFTAFNMVYEFETAAFNTKVGEISMPVRTDYGYHLVKVTDKLPSMGMASAAHIFLKTGELKEDEAKEKADIINEVYNKLKEGQSFETLAKEYSEDKGSAHNGGKLKPFPSNRIIPEFVEQISKLKDGEYSKPFKTDWGWHIVKLENRKQFESFENEKPRIKSAIERDARASLSRKSAFNKIKEDNNYKYFEDALVELYDVVDTNIFKRKWKMPEEGNFEKALFKLNDTEYVQRGFLAYLEKNQARHMDTKAEIENYIRNMFDAYVEESVFEYADAHLEDTYVDFKNLMKEYRDGMLLFEITDKNVWSKAVEDTVGLKGFHENNKEKYMWGDRLKATIYYAKNEDVAEKALKLVKKAEKKNISNKAIKSEINKEFDKGLTFEEKKFEKGQNNIIDEIDWKIGVTEPIKRNNKIVFVKVEELVKPEPKSLKEAKGIITADYQDYLEKKWIEELKSKYSYNVNKKVLNSIK